MKTSFQELLLLQEQPAYTVSLLAATFCDAVRVAASRGIGATDGVAAAE